MYIYAHTYLCVCVCMCVCMCVCVSVCVCVCVCVCETNYRSITKLKKRLYLVEMLSSFTPPSNEHR